MKPKLQLYVKSMGKIFRIKEIALSVEAANQYCERHTDCGVIAEDTDAGLIFIAELYQIKVPSSVLPD